MIGLALVVVSSFVTDQWSKYPQFVDGWFIISVIVGGIMLVFGLTILMRQYIQGVETNF